MNIIWWIYLLLLFPTLTEVMETGRLPISPREMITDAVLTICIGILILLIHRRQRKLIYISETDGLTGLKNRRVFQIDLTSEVTRAHQVLASVGTLLKDSVRSQVDTCYRIGGDEFTILLPAVDVKGSEGIDRRIEMLREQGSELLEPYGAGRSVGIASLQEGESPDDPFKHADSHMYREKKNN